MFTDSSIKISCKILVVQFDKEQRGSEADGDKAGPFDQDPLGLRELPVAARVGEGERNREQEIHHAVYGVEGLPADEQDEDGEADNADQQEILADFFFRLVRFLLLRMDFMLKFSVLLCHRNHHAFLMVEETALFLK